MNSIVNVNEKQRMILALAVVFAIILLGGMLCFFIYLESVKIQNYAESEIKQCKMQLIEKSRDYGDLNEQNNSLSLQNQQLQNSLLEYSGALKVPYVKMSGREVEAVFRLEDGQLITWIWPVAAFESAIQRGSLIRDNARYEVLLFDSGKRETVVDYRQFVDSQIFEDVGKDLYEKSNDDYQFIVDAWTAVTQLTIYSKEIGDVPRHPIETITEGGGDCEDTAILLASIIKGAKPDWKVQLVYMDSNSPENPKNIDHLLVAVQNETLSLDIDTTQNQTMTPYSKVQGWRFDV